MELTIAGPIDRWAEDDPDMLAFAEKNKVILVHNLIAEDGVVCSGYLAGIRDLQVHCCGSSSEMNVRYQYLWYLGSRGGAR